MGQGRLEVKWGWVRSEIIKGWVDSEIGLEISLKTRNGKLDKMGCSIDGLILDWEFPNTWPNLGLNKIG